MTAKPALLGKFEPYRRIRLRCTFMPDPTDPLDYEPVIWGRYDPHEEAWIGWHDALREGVQCLWFKCWYEEITES